ncbi:hypothetical protein ACL6C3_07660 [Capilliphycus salinus ALCB114379]|uniref:hypothetical protein n=1 Tax=Capilliphycus salinus TaxID=2768948 RepID=UPI0039A6A819
MNDEIQSNVPSIVDSSGIIYRAYKALPNELKLRFLAILAELENEHCYLKKRFPQGKLKRVLGTEIPVYTANIDPKGEWKIYLHYADGKLYLTDLVGSQPAVSKEISKENLSPVGSFNEF